MYPNHGPWVPSPSSSQSSLPANNPFLESSAANRFPALDSSTQSFQSSPPYQPQSVSSPNPQFQQQQSYGVPQQQFQQWASPQHPQSPSYGPSAFTNGYTAPYQQPQPTGFTSYGQQQYDQQQYDQQQYGGPQYTGYPQYQQTPTSPQHYQQNIINQFDPYSAVSGGWDGQSQSQNQVQNQGVTAGSSAYPQKLGPSGQQHPRHFIQAHKAELESWNPATWKQALSIFEDLKKAWETRRVELQKHLVSGQYLSADDIANINGMIKNSESNIDSVVASLIQMQEVHSGYKHSLDAAGKRQVREALNAGLQGLPEWP